MDELERVLERKVQRLASGALGEPECAALGRSAETDVSGHERMFPRSCLGVPFKHDTSAT
jgi:hypothetical protein